MSSPRRRLRIVNRSGTCFSTSTRSICCRRELTSTALVSCPCAKRRPSAGRACARHPGAQRDVARAIAATVVVEGLLPHLRSRAASAAVRPWWGAGFLDGLGRDDLHWFAFSASTRRMREPVTMISRFRLTLLCQCWSWWRPRQRPSSLRSARHDPRASLAISLNEDSCLGSPLQKG